MEIDSHASQPLNGASMKRRAACDECRTKKLKCTGEQPNCSRCAREGITCVYSVQKRMGRPKKRQRTDDQEEINVQSNEQPMFDDDQQVWNFANAMEPSDKILTPAASVQPWLLDFGTTTTDSLYPTDSAPPGLTPDNSTTNSPPLLNLPTELQNTHHHQPSTNLVLDPTFTNVANATTDGSNLGLPCSTFPPCACLSTMYLALSELQTMDTSYVFPFALHPLRQAIRTADDVLTCEHCPQRFISAIQNTQLIGTLMMSIGERYSKILAAITTESDRASASGETKKFRLADLNTPTGHLHTNGIGCAAAFNLNLEAMEWRALAKKVVKAEVYGQSEGSVLGDGHECCPFFLGLVRKMETRQEYWHNRPMPDDFPRDVRTGLPMGGQHLPKEDHICLKFCAYARRLVEGYDWS